jgi:peptidylprolyl isomerase
LTQQTQKERTLLKLITPLLALTLAVSASAQTPAAPAKPAAKPAVATHVTAAKPIVHAVPGALPVNIPVVHGIKKPLFALSYIDTVIGKGPLAEPSVLGKSREDSKIMFYTVHYTGWLAKDGTKFDSSVDRGTPITFPYGVGRVIPGWDNGFEGMHIGGKRRLFIPYQLAYGAAGKPPTIPAKSDLIFDVELIAVTDKPPTPPAPPAPAATKPNTPGAITSAPAPAPAAKPAAVGNAAPTAVGTGAATKPATK